jgi:hypothetical protein
VIDENDDGSAGTAAGATVRRPPRLLWPRDDYDPELDGFTNELDAMMSPDQHRQLARRWARRSGAWLARVETRQIRGIGRLSGEEAWREHAAFRGLAYGALVKALRGRS